LAALKHRSERIGKTLFFAIAEPLVGSAAERARREKAGAGSKLPSTGGEK